ncbi:ubiquinone biosynthesis accessory factor UbiJ [Marinobacterium rhizophilum]|uniref:ubiquinone biosynthesis accessory factor UbiJ n=1 Tax=Marinobacterium rhizophilum TaxID=420402 RepID=UPI000374B25A|nr:SCP2 sterol-binding domain-containing protein [Marinobacterium rhizophilum]
MPVNMFNATLMTLLEQSLNRLLSRDPVTLRALGRLDGRVIALEISSPVPMKLFLIPNNEGLQLQQHYGDEPDASIAGSASALLRLVSSEDKAAALFGKGVTISGDSVLANRLQAILADSDIDWEGLLADQIGDLAAHQAANFVRQQRSYWRQTGSSLSHNLGEYLQEEALLLPPRAELEGFMADVDTLRQRSDRLEARLQRLLNRLHPED